MEKDSIFRAATMGSQSIVPGLWAGDQEGTWAGFQQAIVDSLVLFRGEDVSADGEIVVVAVDELEGKHGLLLAVGRLSFVWPERTMIRAGSSS